MKHKSGMQFTLHMHLPTLVDTTAQFPDMNIIANLRALLDIYKHKISNKDEV